MKHNLIVGTWRDLVQTFSQNAASKRVDTLASELAARVGASGMTCCIGLVRPETVASYYGLVYVLAQYGLTLRHKARAGGGTFIYAEVESESKASEFDGATVKARREALPAALAIAG